MAVDKLVDSTQLNTDLTSVANAIRTKGGTSAQLAFPEEFVTAINAISSSCEAVSVVDTPDGNGGTIRTITSVDISDTTAKAADVASGKYFYTSAGVKTLGISSGTATTDLPSTYQKVEYLGVTQNCYIDLGARSYATFGFEVTYYIVSRYAQGGPHLISDTTEYLWFIPRQNNTLVKWGGEEVLISSKVPLNIVNYARFNIDGENRIDIAGMSSQTLTKGTNTYGSVCLFAYGVGKTSTNYHFNGRLYHLRFYNNSEVVEEFIPCYRKSDSVPGLYDIVNQIFYTNSGTGSFTVGQDIS